MKELFFLLLIFWKKREGEGRKEDKNNTTEIKAVVFFHILDVIIQNEKNTAPCN